MQTYEVAQFCPWFKGVLSVLVGERLSHNCSKRAHLGWSKYLCNSPDISLLMEIEWLCIAVAAAQRELLWHILSLAFQVPHSERSRGRKTPPQSIVESQFYKLFWKCHHYWVSTIYIDSHNKQDLASDVFARIFKSCDVSCGVKCAWNRQSNLIWENGSPVSKGCIRKWRLIQTWWLSNFFLVFMCEM